MFEIERTEACINTLKKSIENGERLKRLKANEDFKALITNGYCGEYLTNLVDYVEGSHSTELDDVVAIGKFKRWLNSIDHLSTQAKTELPEQEAYLIELKKGEL